MVNIVRAFSHISCPIGSIDHADLLTRATEACQNYAIAHDPLGVNLTQVNNYEIVTSRASTSRTRIGLEYLTQKVNVSCKTECEYSYNERTGKGLLLETKLRNLH